MKRLFAYLSLAAGVIMILPDTGDAIPAFARKHGFNCNMCHTSFTKLNDWGQRFRNNGYQVPGQQGLEKNVIETAPPISIRTSTGATLYHSKQEDYFEGTTAGNTSGFGIYGFDLLAAGVLHKNISFLMIYTPRVDEPTSDYKGTDASQPGALESANIVFSNLIPNVLNLRIGRFEPAYHAISSKRSYYIMQPYEIYSYQSRSGGFNYDDNQFGLELTGQLYTGTQYGLGLVNGSGPRPDNNKAKDVYLTVHQVIGRGEGQSAGQRVGVFGYLGRQPTSVGMIVAPTGENNGTNNKKLYRLGGDVSLTWKTLNLRGLFMHGVDSRELNPSKYGMKDDYKFSGGFVELDYAALPNNRLLASMMYNWVEPPWYDIGNRIRSISALLRYYLGDWTAVNVALHAEYTHKQTSKVFPLKEDTFALLVDFDF
ncbi:MAG: hypothetical protein NT028_09630 [candidate division Zixibacteria bacterium]|nr:hypothetical protein [candidate division Zixibacteria bacterium]